MGDWEMDAINGYGKYENNEFVYEGEWKNNLRHGKGTLTLFHDGSTYSGDFVKGRKEGKGSWRLPNGNTYEGQWVNNKRHGWGALKEGHNVYEGDWINNFREGKGIQYYADGSKYEGGWKEGKVIPVLRSIVDNKHSAETWTWKYCQYARRVCV